MRNIFVTGVSRGIGLGFAKAYLERGDRVFGAARNIEGAAVRELVKRFPERFTPLSMDVGDRGLVERVCEDIRKRVVSLDLLINNAGMAVPPEEKRIEDISEDDIQSVFNVNTLGPLRVLQGLIPLLREASNAKVVMISSSAASIAGQGGGRGVPYCVSKAGLNMLTKLLSFHCADDGVSIVAVHPGWVRTKMGGDGAALSVEESVSHMIDVIEKHTPDSPLYVDWRGEKMAW